MQNDKSNSYFALLGITGFVGILAFTFYITKLFLSWLGNIQSQLSVAIVAGSLAATASIISLIVTKHLDAQAAIRQEHRAKKIPVYEEVIGLIFRLIFAEKMGEPPLVGQELIKEFSNITQKLTVWGSDEVISAYVAFRTASLTEAEPLKSVALLEDIFLAIRRDIGHLNKGLTKGTILKLFINN